MRTEAALYGQDRLQLRHGCKKITIVSPQSVVDSITGELDLSHLHLIIENCFLMPELA